MDYKGFRVNSITSVKLGDDEFWVAENKMIQERTTDGKNWERKEANASARAKDMNDALGQVHLTMATYLNSIGGDLFDIPDVDEGSGDNILN